MILKTTFKGALAIAMSVISGLAAQAQQQFTIKGQLGPDKQGNIMLFYIKNGEYKSDTSKVTNGAFSFKSEVTEPGIATLYLNKPAQITAQNRAMVDAQTFALEATAITISGKGDLKSAKITGGKSQADYNWLMEQYGLIQKKMEPLYQQMDGYKKNLNDTAVLRVQKEINVIGRQRKTIDSTFIATKTNSFIAFDMWKRKNHGVIDLDLEPQFLHFSPSIRNTLEGKKIATRLATAKKLLPGNLAPDFTLTDTLGKPVSLSSYRGKNVMLCFWSTDFMGFETFTFNLGRVNRRLHDKNFVILGVYYNNNNKGRDSMEFVKSTLATSGMNNWTTLTDINGISIKEGEISPVAKAYGLILMDLPQAYLIGPDGKIIARRLHLEDNELGKKMETMLK